MLASYTLCIYIYIDILIDRNEDFLSSMGESKYRNEMSGQKSKQIVHCMVC